MTLKEKVNHQKFVEAIELFYKYDDRTELNQQVRNFTVKGDGRKYTLSKGMLNELIKAGVSEEDARRPRKQSELTNFKQNYGFANKLWLEHFTPVEELIDDFVDIIIHGGYKTLDEKVNVVYTFMKNEIKMFHRLTSEDHLQKEKGLTIGKLYTEVVDPDFLTPQI